MTVDADLDHRQELVYDNMKDPNVLLSCYVKVNS